MEKVSFRYGRQLLLPLVALLLLILAALSGAQAGSARGPDDFIRDFSSHAIATLADRDLDRETRQAELTRLFRDGFDLPRISKAVLGRHWRRADEAERAAFAEAFESFVMAVYSHRLDGYAGQQLEITGVRKAKSHFLVNSRLIDGDGTVEIDWRVVKSGDDWRVLDVVVAGVSMVLSHRSEFGVVIENAGGRIDALIDKLRETAAAST